MLVSLLFFFFSAHFISTITFSYSSSVENAIDLQKEIPETSNSQDEKDRVIAPPKFKENPTWPHSPYYDEFGPPISMSCDLIQSDGITLLWFKDGFQLETSSK